MKYTNIEINTIYEMGFVKFYCDIEFRFHLKAFLSSLFPLTFLMCSAFFPVQL